MGRIATTLMGLSGQGRRLLPILSDHPRVELIGLAERDPKMLAAVEEVKGCALYDDYRQLVVQSPAALTIVAAPPFSSNEQTILAAQRGSHIWRMDPPGRGVAQAAELIQAVTREQRMLVLGAGWRRAAVWRTLLAQVESLGTVYALRVARTVSYRQEGLGWRGDSLRAGGGVLLHLGYEPIAQVMEILGRPGTVMATGSRLAGGYHAPNYDTEDTATVMMLYPRGATAVVTVSWLAHPVQAGFRVHGSSGSARIDVDGLRIWNDAGQVVTAVEDAGDGLADQLDAILDVIETEKPLSDPHAGRHLEVMATIEAAYVSMRTGQPESTAAFLELHGIDRLPSAPTRQVEPIVDPSA